MEQLENRAMLAAQAPLEPGVMLGGVADELVAAYEMPAEANTVSTSDAAMPMPSDDGHSSQALTPIACPLVFIVGVPNVPTNVSVTGGNGQASLTWAAPSCDVTTPSIGHYVIQYASLPRLRPGDIFMPSPVIWHTLEVGPGSAQELWAEPAWPTRTSRTVRGLTSERSYVFRIAAVNISERSEFSAPSAAVTTFIALTLDEAGQLYADGQTVRFSGTPVNSNAMVASGFTPLAAENIAGTNSIVWRHSTGALHLWRLDASWNFTSSDGWQMPGSAGYFLTEADFGQDVNGDGFIGEPFVVEAEGLVTLAADRAGQLFADGQAVRFSGAPVNSNAMVASGFTPLAAENIAGTNSIVWRHSTGAIHLWRLDASWNFISSDGWHMPGAAGYFLTEAGFGQDFNGDEFIGEPSVIERGFVTLTADRAGRLYANDQAILFAGTPVNYNLMVASGFTPVAAGVSAGRNVIVWRHSTGALHFWRLDASWKFISSDGWQMPGSAEYRDTESIFWKDFNGDGITGSIGPGYTGWGSNLPDRDEAGHWRNGIDQVGRVFAYGQAVRFSGIHVNWYQPPSGFYFGLAAKIGGTNSILWQHTSTGALHFWRFDDSWNFISSDGWQMPGSAEYLATVNEVGYAPIVPLPLPLPIPSAGEIEMA
jgi:hypothetical protein